MRREKLYCAIEEVGDALRASDVALVFGHLLHAGPAEEVHQRRGKALEALKRYMLAAQKFSEASRELSSILGLQDLEDTGVWLDLLSLGASPQGKLREWIQRIDFVTESLPRIARLFQPDALRALVAQAGSDEEVFTDDALLSVIVLEREGESSTPQRLIGVFDSVGLLYGACAELEGLPGDGLTVLACDSGVDKSFEFLGRARVIDHVKDVLLSLWDSVVLHRGKLSNRLETIARDLPVVHRVEELAAHGKLTSEQAAAINCRLVEGASKFIAAGAMIPEIERLTYSPRELMAPALKLVARPAEPEPEEAPAGPAAVPSNVAGLRLANLSEEDRATFLRLLDSARGDAGDAADDEPTDDPADALPPPEEMVSDPRA